MRRSKKLIVGVVLAAVLLAGSIGGVALAQTGGEEESQPEVRCGAFLNKVCEIYEENTGVSINCTALKEAFAEARSEICPEGMPNRGEMDPEALQNRLQDLFDQGKITEEQFENMKARMESMPDNLPGFGFRGHGGFHGFGGPFDPAE